MDLTSTSFTPYFAFNPHDRSRLSYLAEMKRDLAATLVAIESNQSGKIRTELMRNTAIIDVAQLGTRLHALIEPGHSEPIEFTSEILGSRLPEVKNPKAKMKIFEPNLENVFVMATHGRVP